MRCEVKTLCVLYISNLRLWRIMFRTGFNDTIGACFTDGARIVSQWWILVVGGVLLVVLYRLWRVPS